MPLFRVKLIISDIYSDACSFLMKDIELVAYVLAEFKDECPYLCRVFKILNCRHPVTYGFIRCFSISYCHSRIIKAVCKPP